MRRNGILTAALAAAAVCGAPAAAEAAIFWHSYDSGNGRIGRADNDGTNRNDALVSGNYFGAGVGTDGTHVYWGESGGRTAGAHGAIGRATVGGGDVNHAFLGSGSACGVFGVKPTATHLYWLHSTCGNGGLARAIRRSPNTSGGLPVVSSDFPICGFTLDATHVYWSDGRFIGRANLDGSAPNPNFIDLGANNAACGLAVSASHIYWTLIRSGGAAGTTVGRANLDGSAPNNAFITGAAFQTSEASPSGIAVDNTYVYWTNYASGTHGSIGRALLDGSNVDQAFIPSIFSPIGLAVDPPGPPAPGPGPTPSPTPSPGPAPGPTVDPPSADISVARTPSCLSIPGVVRDQRANAPGGGRLLLQTRQVDDPARPLRTAVSLTGRQRIRSVTFRVNGRVVSGATVRAAAGATRPVSVPVNLIRLGGAARRNSVTATVVLASGRRVVLTQFMIVLRCNTPVTSCTRLAGNLTMRCTSRTPLGGRRVRITASRTTREVATGSAAVARGRYTTVLRSRVALGAGTYAYKQVVSTARPRQRYFMIRLVRVT